METSCKTECEATAAVVLIDECYAKCESRVEVERRGVLQQAAHALGSDVTGPPDFFPDFNLEDDTKGNPQGVKPSISTEVRNSICLSQIYFYYLFISNLLL